MSDWIGGGFSEHGFSDGGFNTGYQVGSGGGGGKPKDEQDIRWRLLKEDEEILELIIAIADEL